MVEFEKHTGRTASLALGCLRGMFFLRVILWNLSAFLDSTSILFWLSYSAASAPRCRRRGNRMFYLEGFSGFEQGKTFANHSPKGGNKCAEARKIFTGFSP
jgi:hypothetical protein